MRLFIFSKTRRYCPLKNRVTVFVYAWTTARTMQRDTKSKSCSTDVRSERIMDDSTSNQSKKIFWPSDFSVTSYRGSISINEWKSKCLGFQDPHVYWLASIAKIQKSSNFNGLDVLQKRAITLLRALQTQNWHRFKALGIPDDTRYENETHKQISTFSNASTVARFRVQYIQSNTRTRHRMKWFPMKHNILFCSERIRFSKKGRNGIFV